MITMDDIRETKVCTGKRSCGKRFPLSEFHSTERFRRLDGSSRLEYKGRCRTCESTYQSAKAKAYRKVKKLDAIAEGQAEKRRDIRHTGPLPGTIYHRFFCT